MATDYVNDGIEEEATVEVKSYVLKAIPEGATAEEAKEIRREWKKVRNAAKADLSALILEKSELVVEVLGEAAIEMAQALAPKKGESKGGSRKSKSASKEDVVRAAFANVEVGDSINEFDFYRDHQIGRGEMRGVIKRVLNNDEAEKLWIHFNAQEMRYELQGRGEDMPSNWKGYRPIKLDDIK